MHKADKARFELQNALAQYTADKSLRTIENKTFLSIPLELEWKSKSLMKLCESAKNGDIKSTL